MYINTGRLIIASDVQHVMLGTLTATHGTCNGLLTSFTSLADRATGKSAFVPNCKHLQACAMHGRCIGHRNWALQYKAFIA